MRKWLGIPISTILVLQVIPSQASVKASTVATVGDQCLSEGRVAPGRGNDGSDLVCLKVTLGSSKGDLLWWYSNITPLKLFEIISPSISRNSDSPSVIASRSADKIGVAIGSALKSEELVKDFSSKNFSGGSGTWALATFQSYKNRTSTSFVASQSLVNGIITSKSSSNLLDSKPIAQLVQEYEAIAVSVESKYKTLDQLVSALQSNPKDITFVGSQVGGVDHTFMAMILNQLNIEPAQGVYLAQNSGFDVVNKTLADKNVVALSTSGDFVTQADAGKLRVLGVASPDRLKWLKSKTLQQQNLNLIYGNWYGIFVPPQLSKSDTTNLVHIVDILQKSKQWQKTLSDNYWSPGFLGEKEFTLKIQQQTVEARLILQQLGF